jgi:putative transposase
MAGGVKGIAALAMEAAVALGGTMSRPRKVANPFRYFRWSAEAIHLAVLIYVRFPLSLRNVEDLLFEGGIDVCHKTVRHWRWHLDGSCQSNVKRCALVRRRRWER